MVTLYGLKNCDSCRKAWRWLEAQGIDYRFVDLRGEGVEAGRLANWLDMEGWDSLLNRRSTTWRELPEADRGDLDNDRAQRLMLTHPTLIKRPVLEYPDGILVGFDAERYAKALQDV